MTRRRLAPLPRVVALLAVLMVLAGPTASAGAAPPEVQAPAAIVMETSTGDVPFQVNGRERRPIASTTKMMTALLTLQRAKLDDVYVAPDYQGDPAESVINLRAGEEMKVRDLVRALLLASANDAAATLAQGVSGSTASFVRLMNRQARRLGLRDTSFANPIGLDDPDNYSTPHDLARLAIDLRRSPFARETMDLERATLRTGAKTRRLANRNRLVRRVPVVNGVKTGHTNLAGYILVGSATRRGVTVVSVVLGEDSASARDSDTVAGFKKIVRRGRKVTVTATGLPDELEGPQPAGRRAGTLVVRAGRRVVARVPVVTGEPVPPPKKLEQAKEAVVRPVVLGPAVVLVIAVGSLMVVGIRRRRRRGRPADRRSRRKTPA
jgi:D-alanyl-D-alanine carboxypeptidase (penicillin-binding protein 5/6)